MTTVYLLHYDRPIGSLDNPRGQAQHYLGSTDNLEKRLAQHHFGKSGAGIVRAFCDKGINFTVARTWEFENGDGRKFESRLKKQYKNNRRLCPICQQLEKEREAKCTVQPMS